MLLLASAAVLLAVGGSLPELKGDYLDQTPASLPADCKGKLALLSFGFTYDSRTAVEAWVKAWAEQYGGQGRTAFYQIPMMGGMARLGRAFIDSGMRRGTPKEAHRNVITVYGGVDEWKKMLDFKAPNAAYLVLIDGQGRVVWRFSGPYNQQNWQALAAAAEAFLQAQP
jgi:hypothetical protein